jgi:2'-hydroxyisoflavone reductase
VRVLVVGGTRFVGRHIVQALLDGGHEVRLFHRGSGPDDPFPEAEHRHGDRDGNLTELAEGSWDATIDVSAYLPRQVRALAEALGRARGRAGRYAYISSISAYATPDQPGITESAPLEVLADAETEVVTGDTYGALKALSEYAAVESFGTESLIIRPTYVVGPYDTTGRFPAWVRRLADGGEVLAAQPRDQPVQVVDARDLAAFLVALLEQAARGPFHVAGPPPPYDLGTLVDDVRAAVAPEGTTITWVDADFARENALDGRQLPFWHEGEHDYTGAVDPAAALRHGLRLRPVGESARDVLASRDVTPLLDGVGLDRAREAELLRAWHDKGRAEP